MGFVYNLSFIILFIFLFFLYVWELIVFLRLWKIFLLWFVNVIYIVAMMKFASMFFTQNFDLTNLIRPGNIASLGLAISTFSFMFFPSLITRKNVMEYWKKLAYLAPFGIIITRTGNILNGEVELTLINYATAEILGGFILIFFLFFEKIRKNYLIFGLIFYGLWRILIVEPIRGVSINSLFYKLFFPFFFLAILLIILSNKIFKELERKI